MSREANPHPDEKISRRTLLSAAALAPAAVALSAHAQQTSGGAATTGKSHAKGKVALVTGSSRGIGAAIAKRLARDGYKVTVNCVSSEDLAAGVVRDIEAEGGQAIWRRADVSDPVAVRRLFDENEEAFGGIDVVVANAGIMNLAPFAKMSDEHFDRMIDVNVKGGFYTLREAARRVRNGGRIITLSSSITLLRTPTYGPYSASKAAQDMYASVLAKEVGERQISVNALAPGLVNTTLFTDGKTEQQIQGFIQRTPLGRLGEPEDIANVVAALVSPDGTWVSGQVVYANGAVV